MPRLPFFRLGDPPLHSQVPTPASLPARRRASIPCGGMMSSPTAFCARCLHSSLPAHRKRRRFRRHYRPACSFLGSRLRRQALARGAGACAFARHAESGPANSATVPSSSVDGAAAGQRLTPPLPGDSSLPSPRSSAPSRRSSSTTPPTSTATSSAPTCSPALSPATGATQFNPDYLVAVGRPRPGAPVGRLRVRRGADRRPQGQHLPAARRPDPVMGVRNQDLQRVVEAGVAASSAPTSTATPASPPRSRCASSSAAFVNRPGLYSGTSMDSLLHYLDQAGGIDPERGSFLNVQVKRGSQTRATLSLYDFLLAGRIPLIQLERRRRHLRRRRARTRWPR
jgi:hypothetical protein